MSTIRAHTEAWKPPPTVRWAPAQTVGTCNAMTMPQTRFVVDKLHKIRSRTAAVVNFTKLVGLGEKHDGRVASRQRK